MSQLVSIRPNSVGHRWLYLCGQQNGHAAGVPPDHPKPPRGLLDCLRLFDAGQHILQFPLAGIEKGTYLVHCQIGNKSQSFKVIIL